jgi:NADPH:quinone reductase-like Zn-dependent oxidoreductase
MKAAALDRLGPPEVLELRVLPVPRPGPGEVLIAMHSAGVGGWDADIRRGDWPPPSGPPQFPFVLGADGAGTVAAIGTRVRRFRVGDRVWVYDFANKHGGCYAEFVATNATHVGPMPKRLDFLEAGAAAVTGLTALQGTDDALRVKRGETVLIFGATGAVGTLALQFAKRKGARVIASASGRDGAALAKKLGADGVFDPRKDDLKERLDALAPDGLDAILALAGGDGLTQCLDHLKRGGRVAYPNGVEPAPRKRRGVELIAYDAAVGPKEFARLERAVDESRLKVPIAATFSLAQAAKAHARLERGHVLGRIVLRIRR